MTAKTPGGGRTISLLLLLLTLFLIAHSIRGVADILNTVYTVYRMEGQHPLRPLAMQLPPHIAVIALMTILFHLILVWRRSGQVGKRRVELFLLILSSIPIYTSGSNLLAQLPLLSLSADYAMGILIISSLNVVTGCAIILVALILHRSETDHLSLQGIVRLAGRRLIIVLLCFGICLVAGGIWTIHFYHIQYGSWTSHILRRIMISACLRATLSMSMGITTLVGAVILIRQPELASTRPLRSIAGFMLLIRGASSLTTVQWNLARSSWYGSVNYESVNYASLTGFLMIMGYFTLAGVGVFQILLSSSLLRDVPRKRVQITAATAIGLAILTLSSCLLMKPLNLLELSEITLDPPDGICQPNQTITISAQVTGIELVQDKSNLIATLLLENTTQLDQGVESIQHYDYHTVTIKEEVADPSNATTPIQFRITIRDPGNYRATMMVHDCNRKQPVTGEGGILEPSGEHYWDWTMRRVEFRVVDQNTTAIADVGR